MTAQPGFDPAEERSASTPSGVSIRVLDLAPQVADGMRAVLDLPPAAARTIAIVGLGYVGLPTALAMLEAGDLVIGIDISIDRIRAIQSSEVDLVPADRRRLEKWQGRPDFRLTTDPGWLRDAEAVLVCVPTPVDDNQVPDLVALRLACEAVVAAAIPGQTIVLTSTSYVGCTRDFLIKPLETRGFVVGQDIYVAFSPERIDPGNEQFPQETVTRVIGGATATCSQMAREFVGRVAPVHVVSSPEAAEMAKLLENTFRAVNIALANEIGDVSRALGLDIREVIDAASTKPFGFMPFRPGIGVGGHCIACDPHYLLWQLRAQRLPAPLIEQAMSSIAARPGQVVDRAIAAVAEAGVALGDARVLVVGVAYKPGVSDIRESPSLRVIESLQTLVAAVDYFDPLVREVRIADRIMASVVQPRADMYDVAVIATLHPGVDYGWISQFGRRIVDPSGRAGTHSHADGPFLHPMTGGAAR